MKLAPRAVEALFAFTSPIRPEQRDGFVPCCLGLLVRYALPLHGVATHLVTGSHIPDGSRTAECLETTPAHHCSLADCFEPLVQLITLREGSGLALDSGIRHEPLIDQGWVVGVLVESLFDFFGDVLVLGLPGGPIARAHHRTFEDWSIHC